MVTWAYYLYSQEAEGKGLYIQVSWIHGEKLSTPVDTIPP